MAYIDRRQHLFIVGSARSGTSLMASILQTSALYASYRAETKLLDGCSAKYGDLNNEKMRKIFWNDWFRSRQFKRSGLTKEEVRDVVFPQRSYIGVLGTYMNLMASKQGCERWIDSTPGNSYSLKDIAYTFPNSKVIHMIRDGRAVALSLAKLDWTGVRTTDFNKSLCYAALKWKKSLEAVSSAKQYLEGRYLEVSYEKLVQEPESTLVDISKYLELETIDTNLLDSGFAIKNQTSKSTLHTPNSPFGDMPSGISAIAAYRWKSILTEQQVCSIQGHVGETLTKYNYPLLNTDYRVWNKYQNKSMAWWRMLVLSTKRFLSRSSFLGRYTSSPLELERE